MRFTSDLLRNGKGPWWDWFGTEAAAEWFAAFVALVAVILSARALITVRNQERRSDFFRLHDHLMSLEVQHGRFLMHEYARRGWTWAKVFRKRKDDFELINHAIGCYQMLGQYLRNDAISRAHAEFWFSRIRTAWPELESFIRYRREELGFPHMWDDLIWLGQQAGANVNLPLRG